jgi:hypothetical protein
MPKMSFYSLFTLSLASQLTPALADTPVPPQDFGAYGFVILLAISVVLALLLIQRNLSMSQWSLSDALSEEVSTNVLDKDGKPIIDADQKPVMVTLMRASSSRLIALMGMVGLFSLFMGFGFIMLKNYALTGQLPDENLLNKLQNYFIGGLSLFAPYLINKASGVFDFLSPPQPK